MQIVDQFIECLEKDCGIELLAYQKELIRRACRKDGEIRLVAPPCMGKKACLECLAVVQNKLTDIGDKFRE